MSNYILRVLEALGKEMEKLDFEICMLNNRVSLLQQDNEKLKSSQTTGAEEQENITGPF